MKEKTNHKQNLINKLEKLDDNVSPTEILQAVNDFCKANKLKKLWHSTTGRIVMICSSCLAFVSIILISKNLLSTHKIKTDQIIGDQLSMLSSDILIYAFWIIMPPLWFLFEYVWLFPKLSKFDPDEVADLKYTQELGAKVWAGIVGLITILLYIKSGSLIHN